MSILFKKITNNPIESNCFVIYKQEGGPCLIIDPGTLNCENLLKTLNKKKLNPEYVLLTHEHFDHIWGVNKLKENYNCKIICSNECAKRIIDKKKNMSIFYNNVGFETYPADILIEDINLNFVWENIKFQFIKTEGHTIGSMCIYTKNYLFTGDTLIRDNPTITKFPSGNFQKLIKSYNEINLLLSKFNPLVFPGHGESFLLNEYAHFPDLNK